MKTLISICIPTYNRAELLTQTLDSIIEQIEESIEIIISDNCSSDVTPKIMGEYLQRYSSIRYYRNETNLGFDGNILKLLEYAKGEYIFFCSDDDVVLEGTLSKLVKFLSVNKSMSLLTLNYYSFKGTNYKIQYVTYQKNGEDIIFDNPNQHIVHVSYNLGFISSIVVNREEALKVVQEADIKGYIGLGFVQLYILLNVLLSKKQSAWIGRFCIAQRTDTGGWFPLKFFGHELPRIYRNCQPKGYSKNAVDKVINDALLGLVLPCMIAWRCNHGDEEVMASKKMLIESHKGNPLFWIVVYPFFIIPRIILCVPFRTLRKVKRLIKGV